MDLLKLPRRRPFIGMKSFWSLVFVCGALLLASTMSLASTITLQWDPDVSPDVVGYKVYYSADSSAAPFSGTGAVQGASPLNVANQTSATISGLDPSRAYYFAVTAYNSAGVESAYSNVASVAELSPPSVAISSP